jgi:hypothetical protein
LALYTTNFNMERLVLLQYTPLSSASSIRVLQLLPAKNSHAPLECRLLETSLDSPSEYKALSYVWGDEKDPSTITCNGAQLPITRNLDSALRRFRHEANEVILWVDSICINQRDIPERNSQVRVMADIYSEASEVLIWLGLENEYEDTTAAFEFFQVIKDNVVPKWTGFLQQTSEAFTAGVASQLNLPGEDSRQTAALHDFFNKRPWFKRAWTFQESFLARKKSFHCGILQLSSENMLFAIYTVRQLYRLTRSARYDSIAGISLIQGTVGRNDFESQTQDGESLSSLRCLLAERRGSACKDPRDLVYSLLGAADDPSSVVEPNYEKSFPSVFAEVTTAIISSSGKLRIFSEAGMADTLGSNACSLPSWVPDWRHKRARQTPVYQNLRTQHFWHASGSSKAVISVSEDGKMLNIRGIALDAIEYKQSERTGGNWDWIQGLLASGKLDETYVYTGDPLELAILRTEFCDSQKAKSILGDVVERSKADDIKAGREHIRTLKLREYISSLIEDCSPNTVLYEYMDQILTRDMFPDNGDRLALTKRGMLANVPAAAQPGDIVAVLLGGNLPYLLRPCGGNFELVSDCYVHGLLDGEAFVEARERDDPTYDGVDRTWLERLNEEPIPFLTQYFTLA